MKFDIRYFSTKVVNSSFSEYDDLAVISPPHCVFLLVLVPRSDCL